MLLPAILVLACVFGFLFLGRLAGSRRANIAAQLPAMLFAGAALYMLVRGSAWVAVGLAAAAVLAWVMSPSTRRRRPANGAGPRPSPTREDAAMAEARAILGVGPYATEADIRAAYRTKMAKAHPDRGGSHAEAARLTAARDRLLKAKS